MITRIADFVSHWAAKAPDAEAIVSEGERLTYQDLNQRVDNCAKALLACGIDRGDRVAVLCTARWEAFVLFYALCRIGAVWIGLNPRHRLNELAYVVEDSQPVALFGMGGFEARDYSEILIELANSDPRIQQKVAITGSVTGFTPMATFLANANDIDEAVYDAVTTAVSSEDCAAIVYTSGSTGKPKGAMLPQRGLIAAQDAISQYKLSAYRALNNFPLDHVGGLTDISLQILVHGGTLFLTQRFNKEIDLEIIEKEKITLFFQTVGQCVEYEAMPDFEQRDLSNIELIVWGGEPTPIDMIRKWGKIAKYQLAGWGMTETCGAAVVTPPGTHEEGLASYIGKTPPSVESKVIDEQGNILTPGNTGELCIRGKVLMLGYLNRPEATADTIDKEGWLHTGDLVEEQPDGNLRFIGRIKQMFKSGGYNVYPREIEMVLEKQEGVAMVAVVDAPHPKFNQVGVAFVTAEPGCELHEAKLNKACREELANYKIPKTFFIRDVLPLLGSGKIDKKALTNEIKDLFNDV